RAAPRRPRRARGPGGRRRLHGSHRCRQRAARPARPRRRPARPGAHGMTIRTNLATRPCYNERAVQIAVIVLAVLVAAATAYNAVHLYSLTARESAVAAEIREAESRAQQLQRE